MIVDALTWSLGFLLFFLNFNSRGQYAQTLLQVKNDNLTPEQPATPVGGTVQIKQLIVVPDRVLCTRYFVLYKYRTQFVSDYTRTVHQLTGLTGQNIEVLNQQYSGQLAYSFRFM